MTWHIFCQPLALPSSGWEEGPRIPGDLGFLKLERTLSPEAGSPGSWRVRGPQCQAQGEVQENFTWAFPGLLAARHLVLPHLSRFGKHASSGHAQS